MSFSVSSIFGRQKKVSHNTSEQSKNKNQKPQDQKITKGTIGVMTPKQEQQIQSAVYTKVTLERELEVLNQREADNNQAIINARAEQVLGIQMQVEAQKGIDQGRQMQVEARQERIAIDAKLASDVNEFIDNLDEFIVYYAEKNAQLSPNDELCVSLSSLLEKMKEAKLNIKNTKIDEGRSIKTQISQAEGAVKKSV